MKTTLVSSFIPIQDYKLKTIEDFILSAKPLIELNFNKIIFTTRSMIELINPAFDSNTFWIEVSDEDFILNVDPAISLPRNRNTDKDTLNYLLMQNSKPKFLKIASDLNPYSSDSFIWVDFGISHILKDGGTIKNLVREYNFEDKLVAAGIWSPPINIDIANDVCWVFAGGIIGGRTKIINQFYNDCLTQLRENILSGFITWEVNLWYQLYLNKSDFFNLYRANHDDSMILNIP
jgi:hypothetical protein